MSNRFCRENSCGAWLLLGFMAMSIASWPALVTGQDQIELVRVAAFGTQFYATFPCGDANRNSEFECYGTNWPTGLNMLICEHERGTRNQYREILVERLRGEILDAGYGDDDSLFDVLAAPDMFSIVVWEALAPDTFPSESVFGWSGEHHISRGYFLNYHGSREILTNGSKIQLWKCTGNNQYVPVPFPYVHGLYGDCAFGDFDRDSLLEVATGTYEGDVLVFERIAENQYVLTCSIPHLPWECEGFSVTEADDMDLNEFQEFIAIVASGDSLGNDSCIVKVFEAPQPGQYELVWRTALLAAGWSRYSVTAGDVDGDHIDEFVVNVGSGLRLFKSTGKHEYAQVWQRDIPGMGLNTGMRIFDVNGDGRGELIVAPDSTYIYEDTVGLGIAEFEHLPKPQVAALPVTIIRAGMSVAFPGLDKGSEVAVYDIRGRVVTKQTASQTGVWHWNLTDQAGKSVPAGTYFVTIRSLNRTTQTKLCVIN